MTRTTGRARVDGTTTRTMTVRVPAAAATRTTTSDPGRDVDATTMRTRNVPSAVAAGSMTMTTGRARVETPTKTRMIRGREAERPGSRPAMTGTTTAIHANAGDAATGEVKKNKRLLIGLIIGVAAFLFLGTVGAVLYFAGILGGGASSDMLAWAPADSQSIMYVDVEAADKVDELRNELKADALHMGKHGIERGCVGRSRRGPHFRDGR